MDYKDYGIVINTNKIDGEYPTLCPKCSSERKKKNLKTLYVNLSKKVWKCHHCNWEGGLPSYKYNKEMKKEYSIPEWTNNTDLSDNIVKYFSSRGISQSTLIDFKISEVKEYMPQRNATMNCIAFPYIYNGQVLNIKYRDGAKNFKLYKGAELIFYNLDSIKESNIIYITEGEIDCMSMYEIGIKSVISVPNGASKGSSKLEYLDNYHDLFDNKQVVLCTDNDGPGISLRNELGRRIGFENCKYVDFQDCKDANEYLLKYGKIQLESILKNPIDFPISGVIKASDLIDEINNIYLNGYPQTTKLGIPEIDENLSFEGGNVVLVTGHTGMGKSEMIDYFVCKMSVNQGWRAAYFSPENAPVQYHIIKIAEKIVGKRFDGYNKIGEYEKNTVLDFISDNFFFIMPEDGDKSVSNIITKCKLLVKKHGVKCLILDPYNTFEHLLDKGMSETTYVSWFMQQLKDFAVKTQVIIFLGAHNTKPKRAADGKYLPAHSFDVSGSGNFANKADVALSVNRDKESEMNATILGVEKIRHRHHGKEGKISLYWNKFNGRYNSDMSNWLIKEQTNNTINQFGDDSQF